MEGDDILKRLEKLEEEQKTLLKTMSWLLRAIVADESLKDSYIQSQAKKILERMF